MILVAGPVEALPTWLSILAIWQLSPMAEKCRLASRRYRGLRLLMKPEGQEGREGRGRHAREDRSRAEEH